MKISQSIRRPEQAWRKNNLSRLTLLIVLLLLVLPATNSPAKQKKTNSHPGKIIFLPFTIKTTQPQEHLAVGLPNILATRMTEQTGLAAVYGEYTDTLKGLLHKGKQGAAKKILRKMKGDYLFISSLEQLESGYKIIIHVFSGKTAPTSFSRTAPSLERIISVLDELSVDIAEKVFHKKSPKETSDPTQDIDGMSAFQTEHPDRVYRKRIFRSPDTSDIQGDAFRLISSRSSKKLSSSIRGMDAGDLDGDGREELVLLEQGNLALYRFGPEHFQHIIDYPLPGNLALHRIFLADFDRNSRLEIYIGASNGGIPSSLVLSWDGSKFTTLHQHIPYYLRPDTDSAGNPILLGQTGSIQAPVFGYSAFSPLYRITIEQDGRLKKAEEVLVPGGFNLYDFIRADLDKDGRREFIGITQDNKLVVLDQAGKLLWKSEETYGAGRDIFGTLTSNKAADSEIPEGRTRNYIHTRIIAQDQTGDGRPEIIISRNRVTNIKFFKSLRYFEGSSLAALSWDGSRMNTLWETKKNPGYTVDYQVLKNAAEPNQFRLFFVESTGSGNPLTFWKNAENSFIHLYDMGKKDDLAGSTDK